MTSAGPWSVKGIDPKAREIAKDLARRSGMTLGEWLNQMIIDGGEPEAPPPYEAPYRSAPERRSPLDEYLREPRRSTFQDAYRPPEPARFDHRSDDELGRIARALDGLSSRIEAAEHRSTLAISGIDQSVIGLLSRLDGMERDQGAAAGHFQGALEEVREAQARIADRVRRLSDEDNSRAEALRTLEDALGRLAGQIHDSETRAKASSDHVRDDIENLVRRVNNVEASSEAAQAKFADADMVETVLSRMAERIERAEARTNAAARSLEASFAGLDTRLRAAEGQIAAQAASGPEAQRQFQTLAAELTQKVEASRAELGQRLREAAGGRLDAIEGALNELTSQVQTVEQASAEAIERMGREVTRIAHGLGDRIGAVETRATQAIEHMGGEVARIADAVETRTTDAVKQMGGEMARIAEAMETRMRRADSVQAEALEKLGAEIARIAERLADRVSNAERRSAQALDEVTDQVSKINDKLGERHDRASSELAERLRQSEERTAKLLEEARERLDQRLAEVQRKPVVEPAPKVVETAPTPIEAAPAPAPAPEAPPMFASAVIRPAAAPRPPEPVRAPEPVLAGARAEPLPLEDDFFADRGPATFEADPSTALFDPSDDFEPVAPAAPSSPEALSIRDFAPQAAEPAPGQMSTREMIEQARAAARKAAGTRNEAPAPSAASDESEAPRAFGIGFKRRRKEAAAPTLRTVILASGVATGITMAAMGTALIYNPGEHDRDGKTPEPKGQLALARADLTPSAAPKRIQESNQEDGLSPSEPTLAVAFAPSLSGAPQRPASAAGQGAATPAKAAVDGRTGTAPAQPAAKEPAVDLKDLYAKAANRIDSGDATALNDLRRAANLGYAPAQFYLAKLYEAGGAGLKKDIVEARRWTERAAKAGDPNAMYNLASYLYEGDGGTRSAEHAAQWFRRAAERGVVNSQYNIAQLYEKGYGVHKNLAEALKWYLAAAASGDTEAKQSADALKRQLPADQVAAAERSASSLKTQTASAAPAPTAPAPAR